ncbi:TonB-dependent receptor plug domain-containing protein [Desulfocicer vacuolatum]|uniref:TonB-dependent receptor plug domain-containing protein n=1 Tax=Desulfocicer vacuolatum TaxID=2298 RepID=UPI001E57DABC|nr:TonB-dependent receptor [Desulfocicer vacuolatum]
MTGIFLFLSISQSTLANETTADMGEMVVTATRTQISLDKIGGNSVTVITSEEIQAKQQNSVADLLRGIPGIDLVSNGGPGTATTVFTRGADSKNTLVLIDGIMLNDVSGANRGADLANINVDNIQQIEVIRGAMSVMYGSNATAGVINIITQKGKKAPSASVKFEAGSYGTWKAGANASGATEKINFALSASKTEIDGYSIANDDNSDIPRGDSTNEDDGYENTTLSGNVGIDITDNFNISALARYMDSDVDTDAYNWGGYSEDGDANTESNQTLAKINIHNKLFNNLLDSNLSWQMSRQDRDYFENGDMTSTYDGDTDTFSWQGDLDFDFHVLSIGASYLDESMKSESFGAWGSKFEKKSADTKSYWIQDQIIGMDDLVIIAGVRLDDHETFGDKTTWRLAPSYTIAQTGTTLKASYGTGFRAPSLYELYNPSYGNSDLDAEESNGWDVGVEQQFLNGTATVGLTYFAMDYDNRIDFDATTWTYTQADGETKTKGVEFFAGWEPLDTLAFMLNYTYTDTEDPDGESLVRRPENKVSLNTRYGFLEKGVLNLDVQWVDERKASPYANDKNGNAVGTLDSYTLVNLAASWTVNSHVQLFGRVDNLFDEFYEEAFSYAQAGVSAYAGIKLTY